MYLKENNICVVGLGYIGAPLCYAFAKKNKVIGFDKKISRINELNLHYDVNNQINKKTFQNVSKNILITSRIKLIKKSNIYIIAVPTPITKKNKPDLKLIKLASKLVGMVLKKNDIVVYESTVYPGLTNEVCKPILEKTSKYVAEKDFFIGYSPERINPGDVYHTLEKTDKIVSANSFKIAKKLKKIYSSIIKSKIHIASSIEAAEAAKIIENTQRDINIALINEFSIICKKMNLSSTEVLNLAKTKWNFLNFYPGLVGGHCIGVDPYYLSFKAKLLKYNPKLIDAGRKVNDSMSYFISKIIISKLKAKKKFNSKILILGFAYKENCNDARNSKVADIVNYLKKRKFNVDVYDPIVNQKDVNQHYRIKLLNKIPKKKI